jgi:hypothetical protein
VHEYGAEVADGSPDALSAQAWRLREGDGGAWDPLEKQCQKDGKSAELSQKYGWFQGFESAESGAAGSWCQVRVHHTCPELEAERRPHRDEVDGSCDVRYADSQLPKPVASRL